MLADSAPSSIYDDTLGQKSMASPPPMTQRDLIESFGDETTLHGAIYVFGSNRGNWGRALWLCFLLPALGAVFYTVAQTFESYFSYAVKTTLSYDYIDTLGSDVNQFPSITLCNSGAFKRAFAANIGPSLYGPSFDPRLYSLEDAAKMCPPKMPQDKAAFASEPFQTALASVNMTMEELKSNPTVTWPYFFERIGMATMMQLFALDSISSIVDCHWLPNTTVTCTDLFVNHMTDFGWCFTFNPSVDLLNAYDYGGIGEKVGSAYGMTAAMRQPLNIVNSGWYNGLGLILNALTDELCFPGQELSAGFSIAVHDPSVEPLMVFSTSPTMIAPGFATNVEIIISHTQRNTASQGYCVDSLPLPLYPTISSYFRNACYSNCIAMSLLKACGCLPYFAPPHAWDIYGPIACWFANASAQACNHNFTGQIMNVVRLSSFCAECVEPCKETAYTVSTSMNAYPSIAAFPYLVEKYNLTMVDATGATVPIDLPTFQRNYLYANFYISSLQCATITEDFAMTGIDLVNGIGGALALFIGASMLTIVEIVFCICGHLRYCFRRNKYAPKAPVRVPRVARRF